MKKIIICISLILLIIVVNIFIFYPRTLIQIIGNEVTIPTNSNLTVIYRNSILEGGTFVNSNDINDMKNILESLKSYKYSKSTNDNYKEFDNLDTYAVIIKSNNTEIFKAATRGNKHLSVRDKNGRWSTYKVVGDKFDLEFLKKFHNTLKTN